MTALQNIDPEAFTAIAKLTQAGSQIATGAIASGAAKDQAREADRQAEAVAADERRKGRRLAGKQRAGFAKGGVAIDAGTPLEVLAQTAADTEINALRAAFSFEQQAKDFRSFAKGALLEGILGGGSTVLSAAPGLLSLIPKKKAPPTATVHRGSTSSAAIAAAGRTA